MDMAIIKQENGYNFWHGTEKAFDVTWSYWNITPIGQKPPKTGYCSRDYIEKIKGQSFFGANHAI